MTTTNRFFVTTTLPYVNANPHVGHALEFIQADAIVRFLKAKHGSNNVRFNVGTDEHGQKIRKKAEEQGMDVRVFILSNVKTFVDFCTDFGIGYDNFYRTSDPIHYQVAQAFWNQCFTQGLITKKSYSGQYCVGCESFKKDKDLVNGECPDHKGQPITTISEENYFFLMSKLRDQLLTRLDSHPDFLQPTSKREELRNYLVDMEDLSISRRRETLPRGIPVPNDDEHVMYVWFDALSNYIGACGFPDPSFVDRWTNSIQLCGPDNLRFQGGIWQAMLAGIHAPHTHKLLVHGTILGPDGNKMSKTLGNVINPYDQKTKRGTDAVRLYLLAGLPTYGDGVYNETDLVNLHNSWLCDSLGNLINRVLVLAKKYDTELTVRPDCLVDESIHTLIASVDKSFSSFELFDACHAIHKISLYTNKYFDENKPWDKTLSSEARTKILDTVYTIVMIIVDSYQPIIPAAMARCREILLGKEPTIPFVKLG